MFLLTFLKIKHWKFLSSIHYSHVGNVTGLAKCKVSNLSGYQPMSSFSKTKQLCQSSRVKPKDRRKLKY